MPYISNVIRNTLDKELNSLIEKLRNRGFNPGEINYVFSKIAQQAWRSVPNYERGNDIMGVFESAKLEFYRRILAPYEDKKIQENGDI